ncbi:MAG TPA: tetratricopeptide repeat protein, partial [Gemmataceae bacterium]|nr:tetratricopeptide repeat protein [Gemmataceae bacterium]
MATANGDSNLLFGILALQMDFIQRDALIRAMHAWVLDKAKPLGQILVEQQALSNETHALLDAVVRQHIKQHGDDAEKSLASVSSVGGVREELRQIADPDVQASLAHVPSRDVLGATGPYSPQVATIDSVGAPSMVGRRFRLLRPHAEGGLGKVSVARDEELHRDVALKEIKQHHADHAESRARFLVEAEITGGLEHPGIVPVYGLGAYADGRPFYAMRFIKGDSLKEAIERFHQEKGPLTGGPRMLELRQLLSRFNAVCNAVAYAHSRGVLHRDLKPANVMLGKYGETLVVDWGLAKPLGGSINGEGASEGPLQPASSGDSAPTQMGKAVGTPAYMSPEQAAGRPDQLGPVSDVYSLGATLYCLLTGKAPFERGDLGGVLQRVQRGDFPRPRQVRRDVPRALEAVCLKAMALRPEDRYATSNALAEDVEKWLADEPTTAYREPWRVRAWRWVKRHRTPAAATAAALLAAGLLLGVGLWWKADEDARAAATAKRQAEERDREVRSGLAEAAQLREQGRFGEARTVLKQVEARLGGGGPVELASRLAQAGKDVEIVEQLQETPLLAARGISEGKYDLAAGAKRYSKLFSDYGIDPATLDPVEAAARIRASDIQEQLIVALDFWASYLPAQDGERARLMEAAGRADQDERRKELRQAWSQQDPQALERELDRWDASSLPPTTTVAVAAVLRGKGSASRAEQVLRAVQQVHPNDFWVNYQLSCLLVETPGRQEEALGFLRAAVALQPDSPGAHNQLGLLLSVTGRREAAEKEYRRAVQIKEDYAEPHANLGNLLAMTGRREEAEKEFRRAIGIKEDDPYAHSGLGIVLKNAGRGEEAEKEYRRAIQIKDDFAEAHYNLGILLAGEEGRREEAEKEFHRALQIKEDNADAHTNLGILLDGEGRREEAETELRRAVQLKDEDAVTHRNLGFLLAKEEKREEAETEFRRALHIKEDDPDAHTKLGNLLADTGRRDQAETEYRRALQIKDDFALAHYSLGLLLRD